MPPLLTACTAFDSTSHTVEVRRRHGGGLVARAPVDGGTEGQSARAAPVLERFEARAEAACRGLVERPAGAVGCPECESHDPLLSESVRDTMNATTQPARRPSAGAVP